MNNKKKVIITIIITVLIGLLTVAGSFALWTSVIGNNINVDFNTVALSDFIDYTEGKAVFSGNLEATSEYPEGIEGTYTTFKINTKNNPAYPFYAGLKMQINNISEDLTQSRVLKWTVTSKATGSNTSETVVAESDFVGTTTGDELILVPNILVTDTSTDYNVYIWVDSNNSNASQVEGESIEVELWMDVYQYRAPKVLDAFCYSDGTNVSCNILDSEKLLNRYGLNTTNTEPASYTSISSSEYWTEIDTTITNENFIYFKTSDDRVIRRKVSEKLYQQVEYIESTGTQYIDTGVSTNQNIEIQSEFSTTTASRCYFGARTSTSANAIIFGYFAASQSYVGFGGSSTNYSTTINPINGNKHTVRLSSSVYQIDDVNQTINNRSTLTQYYNIYLGTWNTAGTADNRMFIGKIYSFIIWDNGTLVRNFIPVYRIDDDVAGLYDTVNDVFYTNANTSDDDFTVGPDV